MIRGKVIIGRLLGTCPVNKSPICDNYEERVLPVAIVAGLKSYSADFRMSIASCIANAVENILCV